MEKSHRRRSKTFCIQCTAQQAQENECTDQRALVVSATIYYIQIIMLPIPTDTLYNSLKDFNLFFSEIGSVFQELDSDPDCRAIVLSGNGKMFCAGNPTTPFEHKYN